MSKQFYKRVFTLFLFVISVFYIGYYIIDKYEKEAEIKKEEERIKFKNDLRELEYKYKRAQLESEIERIKLGGE